MFKRIVTAVLLVAASAIQSAGLLTPVNSSLPALEIKDHQVSVIIEDGYAITTVNQVFRNPHNQDLEAIYSFPIPEHGAVAEFTLWIDGKPVSGEVFEKQQARNIYEEEKAAGREAGLAEKDSYRTFEVNVSSVRAGQDTRTRLVYMQTAAIDTGIGRYVYPLEKGGIDEQKLAFWTANETVSGNFSFDLNLRSAYPVAAVRLPNQPNAQATQTNNGEWRVHLSQGASQQETPANPAPQANNTFTLDQDLVVYWRLEDGLPGSVDLVTYKPEENQRGTFMMVVTPGDDLQPITEGSDWIFVLDISGSMQGKYATLADGVQRALGKLRPEDRFRIILFNNNSRELTNGYVQASQSAISAYSQQVANVSPGNGTNLYAGLKQGLKLLDANRTSAIVLVTDGVANVGETKQRKFIEMIRDKDTRLFTFIMGNSANRPMLEAMTKASGGFAVSISNSDDIVGQLLKAISKVSHQALHGVSVKIDGIKTADITPAAIGSLYRGQQLVLLGHYWGDGPANVTLTGKISGSEKIYSTNFSFPDVSIENPEIERLWAFSSIEAIQQEMENFGEQADIKQAATDLALEYSLVTDQTSMLVLREEQFTARNIDRRNQRRLVTEQAAQQQRSQRPAVSRQVGQQQPMYSKPRASFNNGGGALSPWFLLLLLPLIWLTLKQRVRSA